MFFKCELCSSVFFKEKTLADHKLSVHKVKSTFTCKNCSYYCASQRALRDHLKNCEEKVEKCLDQAINRDTEFEVDQNMELDEVRVDENESEDLTDEDVYNIIKKTNNNNENVQLNLSSYS